MKSPQTVAALEKLGRERLSPSFYMREFLYSEVAAIHGMQNIPENPDLALEVGRRLCEDLREPLNATFGRVALRSAYRSTKLNDWCNENKLGCAQSRKNFALHIWDQLDAEGKKGAMACVFLPWFTERFERGADWRALAYWIHDHLPYSELQFFPNLCAFNIGWHEKPKKKIESYIAPAGILLSGDFSPSGKAAEYAHFPPFRKSSAMA